MNDEEFIADMLVRTRPIVAANLAGLALEPIRQISAAFTVVNEQWTHLTRGNPYNIQRLQAALAEVELRFLGLSRAVVSRQTARSHADWIAQTFTSEDILHNAEYFAAQLQALRQLVARGTFTDLVVAPGVIKLTTTPVTIRHDGENYNFNTYVIAIYPATDVARTGLNGAVKLSGGRPPREGGRAIHPHLAETGGCFGNGYEPVVNALKHQSWTDAFLLVDQLLRVYNPSSPSTRISSWSWLDRCPECSTSITEGQPTITLDRQRYHEACTVPLSASPAIRLRVGATVCCPLCGMTVNRDDYRGPEGCNNCRGLVANERQLAAQGQGVCHNCESVYDHEHLDQLIDIGRGDRVCTACTVQRSVDAFEIVRSTRWNGHDLAGKIVRSTFTASALRPNCEHVTRQTPVIRVPTFAICSCGVRQLSHFITPCAALAGQSRCPQCDPDNLGLSREALANPFTCLHTVTDWVNRYVDRRLFDFFDFIHPATVSPETLKLAVKSVILFNRSPAAQQAYITRPVSTYIDFVNTVLGYPAIIASTDLMEMYDATYNHRAHAVA